MFSSNVLFESAGRFFIMINFHLCNCFIPLFFIQCYFDTRSGWHLGRFSNLRESCVVPLFLVGHGGRSQSESSARVYCYIGMKGSPSCSKRRSPLTAAALFGALRFFYFILMVPRGRVDDWSVFLFDHASGVSEAGCGKIATSINSVQRL